MAGSTMRKLSLRNLAAHRVRLALTVLSVVLGTAFVTGSFVFTDTLQKTFDELFTGGSQGVDVRVSAATAEVGNGPPQRSAEVPLTLLDELRALPDVAKAAPGVEGVAVLLDKDGAAVQTGGAPTEAQIYFPPDQSIGDPLDIVAGAGPAKVGEVAINESGAERAGLGVGDTAKVLVTQTGEQLEVTVSAIYRLPTDVGGYIGLRFTQEQAVAAFTDGQHVAYIDLAATPGVAQEQLRDEVAALVPDLQVQTGAQVQEETRTALADALSFFNYFLLAFGAIALVVGTFIIYNTFAMIVAQRLRELALLRAVGASRGQVSRSVLLEALLVGLIGSVIGLGAGVAVAYGLRELLDAFDVGLPSGPLSLKSRTVVAAFAVGVVITLVSAYAPARRASKVPPVAAMREEFASLGESLQRRTAVGAVIGAGGFAAVVWGGLHVGKNASIAVGVGAGVLVLAVLLVSPALSQPFVSALGRVVQRVFGPIGRLARTNAVRNPRRTAATAFALTLGLLLVTMIGVLGSSAKASVDALIDKGVGADFVLTGPQQVGVPGGVDRAASTVAGVQRAAALHIGIATIDGDSTFGSSLSGPLDGLVNLTMVEGSSDMDGKVLLASKGTAADRGWAVGQQVELGRPTGGGVVTVTVGGVFEDNQLVGPWMLSGEAYDALIPELVQRTAVVLIETAPGADAAQVRAGLEEATKRFVIVQVQDLQQYKETQSAQINLLLALLYALLALAVIIAILGIVNTLALSVVERRREIGMLRAVGMLRGQVRRTIYLESALIAVFGAVVGVALGLAFGVAFVRTLADEGLGVIAVPWGQVALMLVSSGVVGVVAALWPAVRAARTRPLEAIVDV